MRANARSKLKWKYDGKGSQTATWENYVFQVCLEMKDSNGQTLAPELVGDRQGSI